MMPPSDGIDDDDDDDYGIDDDDDDGTPDLLSSPFLCVPLCPVVSRIRIRLRLVPCIEASN